MKILGVLYGTNLFGRERENIECFKAFKELGANVQVFSSNREVNGGEVGELLDALGLKVGGLDFGSHFSISYFRNIRGYWHRQIRRVFTCSIAMYRAERLMRPDFIFVGGTMEYLYLWPWLILTRTRIIYRVADGPIWSSKFHLFVYKRLLRLSHLVVCCSEFIAEECKKLIPSPDHQKVLVLPNCVPAFPRSNSKPAIERSKNLRLIYVGQITPHKGIAVLLQSMKMLKNSPVELLVVGGSQFTSEYENELKLMAKDEGLKVTWVGRVPNPLPYYEAADLHVAPSTYEEPFGLVVVEAKSTGTPSIIFPSGGMKSLVRDGVDGWVCKAKTAEELSESIKLALIQHEALGAMGAAALDDYEEHYTFDAFLHGWNKILNPAIQEKFSCEK